MSSERVTTGLKDSSLPQLDQHPIPEDPSESRLGGVLYPKRERLPPGCRVQYHLDAAKPMYGQGLRSERSNPDYSVIGKIAGSDPTGLKEGIQVSSIRLHHR